MRRVRSKKFRKMTSCNVKTLTVILFCSSASRSSSLVFKLEAAGVERIHVVGGVDAVALPPAQEKIDLVVCDSFKTLNEFGVFKALCERLSFFSIVISEALAGGLKWGVQSLQVKSNKYNAGFYALTESGAGFDSLVRKALAVKKIVIDHCGSSRRLAEQGDRLYESPLSEDITNQALRAKQIQPYFQPRLCMSTETIVGVQVVAQWLHPEYGATVLEAFGGLLTSPVLQSEIFYCVLNPALRLHRYLGSIGESLTFSYSLDWQLLGTKQFGEELVKVIKAAGVPLNHVFLDVAWAPTNPMSLDCIENITVLVSAGICLCLCRYDVRCSLIKILADIPFTQIKICSSLLKPSFSINNDQIIKGVSLLAKSVSAKVVIDGVETQNSLPYLKELGVDLAQGDFFYSPRPAAELLALMLERRSIKTLKPSL